MKHAYKVVLKNINWRGEVTHEDELGRFCSKGWAETFAQSVKEWITDNDHKGEGQRMTAISIIKL